MLPHHVFAAIKTEAVYAGIPSAMRILNSLSFEFILEKSLQYFPIECRRNDSDSHLDE